MIYIRDVCRDLIYALRKFLNTIKIDHDPIIRIKEIPTWFVEILITRIITSVTNHG